MMHNDLIDRDHAIVIQVFTRGGTSQCALFVRLEDHVAIFVILYDQGCGPFLQV